MDVFIGNLHPNVTLAELIALFKGFSHKGSFRFEQKRQEDGSTIRFVVAEFDNDKYAQKLIEKFSGHQFHGQPLVLREYFHRSYANERRAVNWREKSWRAGERRRVERRHKEAVEQRDDFEDILASSSVKEKSLDEQAAEVKIQGYANVARKD